jgi:hypothetical protein
MRAGVLSLRWAAAGLLLVTSCLGSASPKAIARINHRGGSLEASGQLRVV